MRRAEETKEDEKSDRWKEEGKKNNNNNKKKQVHKVGASGRCKVAGKATVGGGGWSTGPVRLDGVPQGPGPGAGTSSPAEPRRGPGRRIWMLTEPSRPKDGHIRRPSSLVPPSGGQWQFPW